MSKNLGVAFIMRHSMAVKSFLLAIIALKTSMTAPIKTITPDISDPTINVTAGNILTFNESRNIFKLASAFGDALAARYNTIIAHALRSHKIYTL